MSKKVLVLSASPRKGGNSDLLCDQFMLGARDAGYQAEKIFLRDKKINYCVGCYACKGRGNCAPQHVSWLLPLCLPVCRTWARLLGGRAALFVLLEGIPVMAFSVASWCHYNHLACLVVGHINVRESF